MADVPSPLHTCVNECRYHDKLANFFDQKLVMLEQEKREIQANLNRNLVEFRDEFQVSWLFWFGFPLLFSFFCPPFPGIERAVV